MRPVEVIKVFPLSQLLNKVINEVTGVGLVVSRVNLEGAHLCRIIDSGVLIPLGVDFTSAHITNQAQVIFTSQVDDLGNNFRWYFTGMVPGCR